MDEVTHEVGRLSMVMVQTINDYVHVNIRYDRFLKAKSLRLNNF